MTANDCSDPTQVKDNDYIKYLDGAARPDFDQHLQSCLYCQNEIAAFKTAETSLRWQLRPTKALLRANCPDTLVIGEYALGMLQAKARNEFELHLTTCTYCTQEYQQFNVWAAQTETETGKSSTDNAPAKPGDLKQWLGRVVATMLNVTQPMGLSASGLRGSQQTFPTTYKADEVLVNVIVQKADFNRLDLQVMGEIFSEDDSASLDTEGAEVHLLQGEKVLATELIDEIGNFFFAQVRPENFDMEIRLRDRIVLIPDLHNPDV